MAEDIVIKVDGVSKNFVLPHERVNSVKSLFTSVASKKRKNQIGKETQHALKDISFEIKKGEFFGIVGRNGSGKSTLLKILAGIYQPTSGSMQTVGKLVPFIELGVGFNPELTGRENVYLNGALLGFSQREIAGMYDDIVTFAELERFMDQKLKNYSSGMQVRLAFSMATKARADILLVDEVLAVGDADFQRKCFDYFRGLKKNKKTVVFVSHDMNAVREYCDNAVLIENSELVRYGKSSEIAALYTKMFNQEKNTELKITKRWGDGRILMNNPRASHSADHRTISISFGMEAHKACREITAGIIIKSAAGVALAGTNTKLLNIKGISVEEGEKMNTVFTVDNIFNDGTYTVDIALIERDGISVIDWWEDAVDFKVTTPGSTPYLTSPTITYRTEKT